jgi:phosphoglycolate phosphatase
MIGDRAGDIVGARANGVRAIGVLWGDGAESELAAAGADELCTSPSDLTPCLRRLGP